MLFNLTSICLNVSYKIESSCFILGQLKISMSKMPINIFTGMLTKWIGYLADVVHMYMCSQQLAIIDIGLLLSPIRRYSVKCCLFAIQSILNIHEYNEATRRYNTWCKENNARVQNIVLQHNSVRITGKCR